ncbi:basement membrane-specific heparan sulfate proteoglycan core protein-like [Misgurnus anguillicaudatus]|uniref:basement membrane-specific heparan sulfate proteoglycan core protein-like n=1 Tax=Misgurnus anguillicaudatus TaxID=75329 RepID=UPI003CCF112A
MELNSAFTSLILLINIQGYLTLPYNLTVKCEPQNICALREDNVSLTCSYSDIDITNVFWISQKQRTNWRNKDEPEDLTLDSDYSGRVDQWITKDYSILRIYHLRERDSGEYQVMFIMKDGVKHLSSVTVNLTVTVLQVKIHQESTELKNQKLKLTCDTSCTLTSRPKQISWRKDGQHLKKHESKILETVSSAAYSCLLNAEISAPVCLSNSSCWGVTYTSRRVCALVGSTVDIHSSYSHPTGDTVEKTYWHLQKNNISKYLDLRDVHQFAGRVEYMGNTLRIKDVNMSDAGEYRFRIITNTDSYSGSPGVILTVTGTKVRSSPDPVIDGEKVILSCLTGCTLDNKHTYIWYKNGQQVTDGLTLLNKLYLDSINSEELQEYSCTVRDTIDKTNEAVDSSVFLSLLVFLPQFLIIEALWM